MEAKVTYIIITKTIYSEIPNVINERTYAKKLHYFCLEE